MPINMESNMEEENLYYTHVTLTQSSTPWNVLIEINLQIQTFDVVYSFFLIHNTIATVNMPMQPCMSVLVGSE